MWFFNVTQFSIWVTFLSTHAWKCLVNKAEFSGGVGWYKINRRGGYREECTEFRDSHLYMTGLWRFSWGISFLRCRICVWFGGFHWDQYKWCSTFNFLINGSSFSNKGIHFVWWDIRPNSNASISCGYRSCSSRFYRGRPYYDAYRTAFLETV